MGQSAAIKGCDIGWVVSTTMARRRARRSYVPPRVEPVQDPSERINRRRLFWLVAVETLGIALLLAAYSVLEVNSEFIAPLLIPPIVTFVLVFATARSRASRPGRVLASYAIAAVIGLGIAAIPGPTLPLTVVGAALTLFLMHWLGVFHAPAVAVAITAEVLDPEWGVALVMVPVIMGFALLAVIAVWIAHRLLGDADYPERWW